MSNTSIFRFAIRSVQAWHQRQILRALDDRQLEDIGVNRDDLGRETTRHLWELGH
jgi:uncharacterized protein YjiS (DUF1127 family)